MNTNTQKILLSKKRKVPQKKIGVYGRVYTPYGWASNSKVMQNYKALMPKSLTQKQINLVVGLLLSDASIQRNPKGKFQNILRFSQNIVRKERIFLFYDVLYILVPLEYASIYHSLRSFLNSLTLFVHPVRYAHDATFCERSSAFWS